MTRRQVPRVLPALAVATLATAAAVSVLGDTFDADGSVVAMLHVTRDAPGGEPDYASLIVYERGANVGGWVDWTCLDHQPAPDVNVFVHDTRSTARQTESDTETIRFRVDANPMRRIESVPVYNVPATDGMRAGTGTVDFAPKRGFLDELAAGKQLIVQAGRLRILTLDLATANPDVVEFKEACDRMHANAMRPPHRWALPAFEDLDPFTDRGQRGLWLFHQSSHDGGHQPQFSLNCGNDEVVHGVNVGVHLPRALRPPDLPMAATSEIRLKVDDGPVRTLEVATGKANPDRWTTFHLPRSDRSTAEIPRLLAVSRSMTVLWFDLPPMHFDLAGGRPVIAEFAATCEAMLREPPMLDEAPP